MHNVGGEWRAAVAGSIVAVGVAGALLVGCRGEARDRDVAAPVDDKLAWPALDDAGLLGMQATAGYELGAPVPLAISPDGAVLFRRSKPRDPSADLYQLDPAGKITMLAAAAALLAGAPPADAERSDAARGIDAIEISDDGTRVLVPLAGRLFIIDRTTATARELPIGPHRDPRLSPDGTRIGFVRDGDLWVASIAAPGPLHPARLTQHPADRGYATPDPAAAALGRQRGYWWAPDGQSIAFQRTDARAVDTLYLADPSHLDRAPVAHKIARSGAAIAGVDLGIVPVRGGAPRWVSWETARYPYLARVIWPARGALTLVVVNREQSQVAALAVDPATGASRPLVVDKDPAWINLAPEPLVWLPDGAGFLWMTERSGAWSLERYAADGTPASQTVSPDIGLRRVVGLAPDGRSVVIEATTDPREHHVWRVAVAGGAPTAVTASAPGSGGVDRAFSAHGVVVVTAAHRGGGRTVTVVRADGTRSELPSVAERPKLAPTTTLETVTLDDHLQYAAITRPHGADPAVRYPVLLRVDGEPDRNAVLDAGDAYAVDQWYADAGFIVVRSDGRGTPGRDRTWQRRIAGDALTIPMNDQIGAVNQLAARYPQLDASRVGVIGTGVGGNLAALAATLHPDVFAAAVAVSPVADWGQLDAAYAERYMKTPAANPEGYRRTAVATYAEQLARPLLVITGSDDRLRSQALALIDALSAAGKRVELAALPAAASPEIAGARLAVAFLRDKLGPPVRPAVMPAPRSEEEEEERERSHAGSADRDRRGSAGR